MKATPIVIQNEAGHAEAKALVERLMDSSDSTELAPMAAHAHLVKAYEHLRSPRRAAPVLEILTYPIETAMIGALGAFQTNYLILFAF